MPLERALQLWPDQYMRREVIRLVSAVGFGSLVVAGCQSARKPVTSAGTDPRAPMIVAFDSTGFEHTLVAGDVISLHFPYRPSQDVDAVIRLDGRITVPYVGSMLAGGQTAEAVGLRLATMLDSLAYSPSRSTVGRSSYLINPGDVLEVRFRDATGLNTTLPVRPDGKISLPLVKSVVAEGKSPEELERELIVAYNKFLNNVDLVVIVREFRSDRVSVDGRIVRTGLKDLDQASVSVKSFVPRQVFVAGEVRLPGFIVLRPPLTAFQAVISASGPLRSAKLNNVFVLRSNGSEKPTVLELDLSNAFKNGAGVKDIVLRPFDIVIVPKSKIARLNDVLDQYLYQLIPATRNVNFTYFYDLSGTRRP